MGKKKNKKKTKKNKASNHAYDATADMFAGVENVSVFGGSGVYLQPGVYHLRCEEFKRGMSTRPGEGAFTVLEVTVLDVLIAYEGTDPKGNEWKSNEVGERPAWIQKNAWGDNAHSARKDMVSTVMECDQDDVTSKYLLKLTDPKNNDIRGKQVIATAVHVPRKDGGVFTKLSWDALEDYEAPSQKKGKAKKKKKKKSKKGR